MLSEDRSLIVVSNRGPVGFSRVEDGSVKINRSGGGLVTALLGLAQNVGITWVASALNELEEEWGRGELALDESGRSIDLHLVPLEPAVYDGYYNTISNPLLWFLQHSMWDFMSAPTITRDTWQAWEEGYVAANQQFANAVAQDIRSAPNRALVMLQDYHLYLLPRMLRKLLRQTRRSKRFTLTHFVHIPWPGPEDLRILPSGMRQAILEGLTAVDVLGFQTREDGLSFLRSVESHLPRAHVNYKHGRIWHRNHATVVRDFPISIDVSALKNLANPKRPPSIAANSMRSLRKNS